MNTTKEYLGELRAAPQASRNVQAGRGNRTGFVMSAKMGHSVDFESNNPERAAIWLFEHSPEIKEFYSQPLAIKLALPDKNGDIKTMPRTFDYATVDEDGELTLVECKRVADLKNLSEKNPYRWIQGKDGKWRSPVVERELAALGFRFLLITDEDFNPQLISNLEYLSACPLRVDQANSMHRKIETAVSAGPKSIKDLCATCNCSAHDILEAYQLGRVYIDLEASLLARPDLMPVFSNSLVAQAYKATAKTRIPVKGAAVVEVGDVIDFDGAEFDVDIVARDTFFLRSKDGKSSLKKYPKGEISDYLAQQSVTLLKQANTSEIKSEVQAMIQAASPKTLRKAMHRAACARGDKVAGDVSVRTLQRWRNKLRESVRFFGVDFAVFLEPVRQGNHGRRLSDATYEVMDEIMREVYLSKQAPSLSAAYGELLAVCEERSIREPSYSTFRTYVDSQTTEAEQLRKRLNGRAAYSLMSGSGTNYDPNYLGDYAWHRAHIDAKQLDMVVVCPRTGKKLGRPWMTLIIAPKVRMVLGYALTFESPSANTTLLALRDVYTQWGALPHEVVMDNGREFKNLAINGLLAAFGTHVTYRPPANPRFGSIIERFFGVFDQRFAHRMAGSTHALSRKTGVNKENDPANRACWDLGVVDETIREFIELYHDQVHPTRYTSPNEEMKADMEIHPNGKGVEL
jgi:putative transposase